MYNTLSFAEIAGQHAELLPARTVLSTFSGGGGVDYDSYDKGVEIQADSRNETGCSLGSNFEPTTCYGVDFDAFIDSLQLPAVSNHHNITFDDPDFIAKPFATAGDFGDVKFH